MNEAAQVIALGCVSLLLIALGNAIYDRRGCKHFWYVIDGAIMKSSYQRYYHLRCSRCSEARAVDQMTLATNYPQAWNDLLVMVLKWGPVKALFE